MTVPERETAPRPEPKELVWVILEVANPRVAKIKPLIT